MVVSVGLALCVCHDDTEGSPVGVMLCTGVSVPTSLTVSVFVTEWVCKTLVVDEGLFVCTPLLVPVSVPVPL